MMVRRCSRASSRAYARSTALPTVCANDSSKSSGLKSVRSRPQLRNVLRMPCTTAWRPGTSEGTASRSCKRLMTSLSVFSRRITRSWLDFSETLASQKITQLVVLQLLYGIDRDQPGLELTGHPLHQLNQRVAAEMPQPIFSCSRHGNTWPTSVSCVSCATLDARCEMTTANLIVWAERALELIGIAHPNFRAELTEQGKRLKLI